MKAINIHNNANINAEGKLNSKHCKPIICLETGEVFTSVTDAAEVIGCAAQNLSTHLTGNRPHIKGKHFCYLSKVTESLDVIVSRLRETSAMEEDAKKWRAQEAEKEAIRKAEERRLEEERKARERYTAAVAKAEAKVAKCAANCAKYQEMLNESMSAYDEANKELEALLDKGDV